MFFDQCVLCEFFFCWVNVLTTKRIQQSCQKVHREYTKGKQLKRGAKKLRKTHQPQKNHLYPIQVRKSSKYLSLSPLYTLDQDQKLQMKELFNFPIQVRKSSKYLSLSPLYTLDQDQKLQMKELFNLYTEKASLSKATLLLGIYLGFLRANTICRKSLDFL